MALTLGSPTPTDTGQKEDYNKATYQSTVHCKQPDYVLMSRALFRHCRDAEATGQIDMNSDHKAVVAIIEIPVNQKTRQTLRPAKNTAKKQSEACTGILTMFSCMMRTCSPDREWAKAHALWHSGHVRAVYRESQLDERSLLLHTGSVFRCKTRRNTHTTTTRTAQHTQQHDNTPTHNTQPNIQPNTQPNTTHHNTHTTHTQPHTQPQ